MKFSRKTLLLTKTKWNFTDILYCQYVKFGKTRFYKKIHFYIWGFTILTKACSNINSFITEFGFFIPWNKVISVIWNFEVLQIECKRLRMVMMEMLTKHSVINILINSWRWHKFVISQILRYFPQPYGLREIK